MAVFASPEDGPGSRFRRVHLVVVPALLLVLGTAMAHRVAALQGAAEIDRAREHVTAELDAIRGALSRELYSAIHLTEGIVSLVTVDGDIDEPRFSAIADKLIAQNPLIRNVALAPGNVIRYVHPREGNQQALGLDYLKLPEQRTTVLRAMSEHRLVVAGPVALVQGGVGIIGRRPIYVTDRGGDGRARRYWGISATVIDFAGLTRAAGLDAAQERLALALRGTDGRGKDGAVFWGDGSVFAAEPVVLDVPLPSGSWQVAAVVRGGWPHNSPWLSGFFAAGGLLSVTLAALLFKVLQISAARRAEVLERRHTELELRQRNRALRLFSLCNGMVIHARDEETLFRDLCRMAVDNAGYRMAWVGQAEHDDARTVRPLTHAGPGAGFLDRIHVSWGDNQYGQGTAGVAIRTHAPALARDLMTNPAFAVWHEVLKTRDFAAAIAVPLVVDQEVFGVLLVYAAEPDAFDATEVGLLDELGNNIAHGIASLRAQKERTQAMAELERARTDLERRVQERTRQLLVAKEAAEAADRVKSAFLATMSHELRTPLNSILGFTGIILQKLAGPLTEEQDKQLHMVQSSAHHLLALINDVLDISKIEAGQLEVRAEPFSLRQSIDKVTQTVMPLATKKGLRLALELDPELDLWTGDQRRVEQVLMNLLGNAIKFTDQGQITLQVRLREVDVQAAITDTGAGIKAEDLPKLFEPFRQMGTGLARRYDGTGLGLSICRKLLELMGGTISARSGLGIGSTFTFTLPRPGGKACALPPC